MVGFGAGFDEKTFRLVNAIRRSQDRVEAYDLLYGDKGVRLNVVRLTISPNAKRLPGAGGHRYDWSGDGATQSAWQSIAPVFKRTKPILYAVPFTPPARWKTNGRLKQGGSLKREFYRDYAEYLVDFLEYQHKVRGIGIDVLSLQNEPGVAAPWESCVWSGEELRDFLKIVAPLARSRGLATEFMLSEGTAWSGAWQRLQPTLADPDARRFLNVMASHSYGAPDDVARRDFAATAVRTGLPVWMSEMSMMFPPHPDDPSINEAIRVAQFLRRDLVDAHASVWIYCFAIFTAKFQGSMGVLSPADGPGPRRGSLVVPKRLWAIANFSRFVRPGWKLIQVDGAGNAAFVDAKGDAFVVVAINAGATPQPAAYAFGDWTIGTIKAFATTAQLNLDPLPPPVAQPHGFTATLPPMSVTTFEGRLVR
jgi:glucuronoarabinoxylan endo-1,4-beta-xylanase